MRVDVVNRSAKLERTDTVAWRIIEEEAVLVPVGRSQADLDAVYVLNEVGSRIWDLLDGTRSASDITKVVVAEFQVDLETAQSDVAAFLGDLLALDALREV